MQDKILLGFLLKGDRTGYQIKKEMEGSTNFFFNTSLGSTNPALKKLELNQMVISTDVIKNGRLNKIYSITKKGKEHFHNWMTSDIVIPKIKNEMLLRVFFFSQIDRNEKESLLQNFTLKMKKHIEELEIVKENINADKCDKNIYATLEFGIDYYTFIHNWYKKYSEQISEGEN